MLDPTWALTQITVDSADGVQHRRRLIAHPNDIHGRGLDIYFISAGVPLDLSGVIPVFTWRSPDGRTGATECTEVDARNGHFHLWYPGAMCSAKGTAGARLDVPQEGDVLAIPLPPIDIPEGWPTKDPSGEDTFSLFSEALTEYRDTTEKMQGATDEAEAAAKRANQAAEAVEGAVEDATAAAQSANAAASEALSAAETATSAAARAEGAASAAEDQTALSEAATQAANEAAKKASDQADATKQAADAANEAALGADESSAKADASAANADRAAERAETGEDAREKAEAARAEAEEGRASADAERARRQDANDAAQTANDTSQASNDSAQTDNDARQTANDLAQAKNNTDQAANNQAALGLQFRVLTDGEFDPGSLEPTVEGAAGLFYLTPYPKGEGSDLYAEWVWIDPDGRFERVGNTSMSAEPVTTDEVDQIISGETVTSEHVTTGNVLSYYDKASKARTDSAIAAAVSAAQSAQTEIDSAQDSAIAEAKQAASDALGAFGKTQAAKDAEQDSAIQAAQSRADEAYDHLPELVTQETDGLMAHEDKVKLDGMDDAISTAIAEAVGESMEAIY